MEIDAKTVAELWEAVKEYVPANKRDELAVAFLEVFVNNDVEITDLDDLHGVDDSLDDAMEEVLDHDADEDY